MNIFLGVYSLQCPDWNKRFRELSSSNHFTVAAAKWMQEKKQFEQDQDKEEEELHHCRSEILNNTFTVPRLDIDGLDDILRQATPQERLLPTQIPIFLPLYHTATNNFTCFCGVVHDWLTQNCD